MVESLADRRQAGENEAGAGTIAPTPGRMTGAAIGQAVSRAFLASLHPSGDPATIRSIEAPTDTSDGKADVLVLALTEAQCRDARSRRMMVEGALSLLAPGGVLWVDAPLRWRSATQAALRASGLDIGASTVHRRRGTAWTEFALTVRGLRFALSNGLISRRWRFVLAALERVPGGRAQLLRVLPGVGFTAFRPGTAPFGWLIDRLTGMGNVDVALTTSWRGEHAPFLVFALADRAAIIAKRGGPKCCASIAHEADMLRLLEAGAAKAGLAIPRMIDFSATPRLCSLIETTVPGRPMAGWIREGQHRDLGAIADRLANWLGQWNSQTVRHVDLTPALGESLILAAARELAGTIDGGAAYLDWLSRETGRLIGRKVPLVAAHNDLTMANVLGDISGIRSIVDWEAASPDGLPLADFRYAVCDAAAAISGGDRLAAFRACFLDDGEERAMLKQCEAPLRAGVGGPPEWLDLCVHASWLRHAANEQARSSRANEGFIAIADALARSVSSR